MTMERIRHYLDKSLEWLLVALMGTMTLNVLWQVFTRFILRNPSSFTEELARYILVWLGLLGAAYGVGKKVHLAIDLLGPKLKGRTRHVADMFVHACVLLFAGVVMIFGGASLVNITNTLQQISAALQIKLAYVYFAIPLSGLIIAFYAASSFWRSLTGWKNSTVETPQVFPVD